MPDTSTSASAPAWPDWRCRKCRSRCSGPGWPGCPRTRDRNASTRASVPSAASSRACACSTPPAPRPSGRPSVRRADRASARSPRRSASPAAADSWTVAAAAAAVGCRVLPGPAAPSSRAWPQVPLPVTARLPASARLPALRQAAVLLPAQAQAPAPRPPERWAWPAPTPLSWNWRTRARPVQRMRATVPRAGRRSSTISSFSLATPQHFVHLIDLNRLIGVDIRRELVHRFVLRGAVGLEQLVDHVDGALVMLDHPDQELSVELGSARAIERRHLLVAQHAGHQHLVRHAVHRHLVPRRRGIGNVLPAIAQPRLHHRNLVALPDDDALAENGDVLTRAV